MSTKNERIYLRTTKEDKEFLQMLADRFSGGNLNAFFDKLIKELREDYEGGE